MRAYCCSETFFLQIYFESTTTTTTTNSDVWKPNFGSVSVFKNPNRNEPKPKGQIRNFGFRGFSQNGNLSHTNSEYLIHSHKALTFFTLWMQDSGMIGII